MELDPIRFYEDRSVKLKTEMEKLERVCRIGSFARGALFLIVAGLFFAAFFDYQSLAKIWWMAFGVSVATFLAVVVVHHAFDESRLSKLRWYEFFQQGIARIRRDWPKIKNPQRWVSDGQFKKVNDLFVELGQTERQMTDLDRAAVTDIDLEGERSLWQLLNLARTHLGQETLNRWMFQVSKSNEIVDRQKTIQRISEDNDWRHDFLMSCSDVVRPDSSPSEIVRWAIGDPPPAWLRALVQVARLNTLLFLAIGLAGMFGVLSAEKTGAGLLVLIAANFLISVVSAGTIHEIFRRVGARTRDVVQYKELLERVENAPATGGSIDALKQELYGLDGKSGTDYATGMRRLVNYSLLSNIRSGMTFPIYVFLQFFFLWDLHVFERLESWRRSWGPRVPRWFYVLGQFEALAALGQFRFDHPDWKFPSIEDSNSNACKISGENVGHPLLGPGSVTNPVSVGCGEKTLLVTGSNMSGKSTYLRTLGVNLILARMGSVVFASSFKTPSVELGTSMRVADSLSDGISFFMSELKRLKQVVDRAKQMQNGSTVFVYLLDEILQGTNSQERQIAVTRVIQQLLRSGAVGALSTHDLQLPEVKELDGRLDIVHFKESFKQIDGKEQMTFDYLMRPGMTPTTNALKLLALVGLDEA